MKSKTYNMVLAAIIAAAYAALTLVFAPISFGPIQVRIAEALTVLPFFSVAAVPGLFVGCLAANAIAGAPIDIVFGSLATLVAAILSRRIKNKWLVPLPPVLVNAVVIGAELWYITGGAEFSLPVFMLLIGGGQAIACYALGLPLIFLLDKNRGKLGL